jgi:hypothetical protein
MRVDNYSMIPDASKSLIKATMEQDVIGWDHWMKGWFTKEWATLVNYDIETTNSGIKFNSSEKWANDIIHLNWDFLFNMWIERNKIEHDSDGDPELRKKEKIIEIIQGESKMLPHSLYSPAELTMEHLIALPKDNLVMVEHNIKNAKISNRKKNETMEK